MGANNQMNRFILNLAQLSAPLRPLLSKEIKWNWTKTHGRAFEEVRKAIQTVSEIQHFKRNQTMRVVCDASREVLGAILQQKTELGWKAVHFASRLLTTFEQKYSIKVIKLVAVVWEEAVEQVADSSCRKF